MSPRVFISSGSSARSFAKLALGVLSFAIVSSASVSAMAPKLVAARIPEDERGAAEPTIPWRAERHANRGYGSDVRRAERRKAEDA